MDSQQLSLNARAGSDSIPPNVDIMYHHMLNYMSYLFCYIEILTTKIIKKRLVLITEKTIVTSKFKLSQLQVDFFGEKSQIEVSSAYR